MSLPVLVGKMTSTSGKTNSHSIELNNMSSNLKESTSRGKNTIVADVIADGRVSPYDAVDTVAGAETVGGGRTTSATQEDANVLSLSCRQDTALPSINAHNGQKSPTEKGKSESVYNKKLKRKNIKLPKIAHPDPRTYKVEPAKETRTKVVEINSSNKCRSCGLIQETTEIDSNAVTDISEKYIDGFLCGVCESKLGISDVGNDHDSDHGRHDTKDARRLSTKSIAKGGKRTKPQMNMKLGLIGAGVSMTSCVLNSVPKGKRYEDYFRDKPNDEEEFGKKPRWFRPRLKYYLREMGCGVSNQVIAMEGKLPVVVFGATGVVGGSVVRALLKDPRFSVRAVTRTPTTDQARALAELGAVVVSADLNDVRSLQRVMEGVAGVFLTTNFWEHLSKQKELTHGMNAIDAAVSCNVHHFIFQGSDHTREDDKPCGHMNAKAAIEEYVKETSLAFTSIHMPFLYENLLSLFKPHCVAQGLYTLPIPMGDVAMDCMALHDFARCVVNIFLRPKNHMLKSVELTGDRMTIQHVVDVLNRNFDDRKFVYHKMSPDDFATFDFQGCQDLAAMFEYMQTASHRDPRITRRIHHSVIGFDRWVSENKQALIDAMKDIGDEKS